MWGERLKECGLGNPNASSVPVKIWKNTRQDHPDPENVAERITGGERLDAELGSLSSEEKERGRRLKEMILSEMTSKEAAEKFGGTAEQMRQDKSRALKKASLTIDETWYRASLRLENPVSGMYTLVRLPHQAPRMYFLMGEEPARKIVAEVEEAHRWAQENPGKNEFARTPYSLIDIFEALYRVGRRAKGKSRKSIAATFQAAPVRIWTFE
jgi:hypothetical protein